MILQAASLALALVAALVCAMPVAAQGTVETAGAALPRAHLARLQPVDPAGAARLVRLRGEADSLRLRVFVAPGDRAEALVIVLRSGIDALSDLSRLAVAVNEVAVGSVGPAAFHPDGFSETMLALPPGLIVPGWNEITLDLRQQHRIYCGPDAAFALWAEIDLGRSGLRMLGFGYPEGPEGFRAAVLAAAGRIDLVADPQDVLTRLGDVAHLAAATGRPLDARIVPAFRLAVTEVVVPRVLPSAQVTAAAYRTAGDGAAVHLVPDLSHLSAAVPAAAPAGVALRPGREVPLADLGMPGAEIAEHWRRLLLSFTLPSDWRPLARARARLKLHMTQAADLPAGARLQLSINGYVAGVVSLPAASGSDGMLDLPLPVVALGPGRNQVVLEILIPAEVPDAACPALTEPFLRIDGAKSRIVVPAMPPLAPRDIATTLAGFGPDALRPSPAAVAAHGPEAVVRLASTLAAAGTAAEGAGRLHLLHAAELPSAVPADPQGAAAWAAAALTDRTLPPADPGPLAREVRRVMQLVPLPEVSFAVWAEGQRPQAALLQPWSGASGDLWLAVGPDADLANVADALFATLGSAQGPAGQVAILDSEGVWHSWRSPLAPLHRTGPVALAGLPALVAVYAVWHPGLHLLATLLATGLSALAAALVFLKMRRRA